jgi:hypothetical protein
MDGRSSEQEAASGLVERAMRAAHGRIRRARPRIGDLILPFPASPAFAR